MKKRNLFWFCPFIIMGLLFLTDGCKDDDDDKDEETVNYFKVGGEYSEISHGALISFGTDDYYEGYNFDLYLVSAGISDGGDDGPTGSGVMIYFELFTSSSTSLASGEYNYDDESDIFPVGTFDYADYCLDWSDENEDNSFIEFASGKVNVSKVGNEYILNISGKDEFGNTITGYYKGLLTQYDGSKKSAKVKTRGLQARI